MKVIIVGAGVMGLATAHALTRAGHSVTLVERGAIPNPLASSVDQHRVIRHAYGEAFGYAAMVADAFAAWDRLWADLGAVHYVETGHVTVGPADEPWIAASQAWFERAGIAHEIIEGAALQARLPHLVGERAMLTPKGGALLADRICKALADGLRKAGVDIRAHAPVADVDPGRAAVRFLRGKELAGDALVVTAGAWIDRLVPALHGRVAPSRQVVVYVAPPSEGLGAAWAKGPVLSDIRAGEIFYAIPPVAGTGLKFGDHRFSGTGDPEAPREVSEAEIETVMALARGRLTAGNGYRVMGARSCFYAVTEGERFLAHREGRMLALSPCSGHGFKFAALIGERAAAAATEQLDHDSFARWLAGAEAPGA